MDLVQLVNKLQAVYNDLPEDLQFGGQMETDWKTLADYVNTFATNPKLPGGTNTPSYTAPTQNTPQS